MGRVGFIFTLDSFIAVSLLVLGLILTSTMFISEHRTTNLGHISEDLTSALATIRVVDLDDPYVQKLVNNGTIITVNNTLLEQIGEFWAKNQTAYARYLAENLTEGLVPNSVGYGIYAGGEMIYERNKTQTGPLVPSRKMVSGIEKGKPVLGATSQAYLVGIREKTTSDYIYFGGFAGQGNLTRIIRDLPSDANISEIIIELDAGSTFDLNINGAYCDTFVPSSGYMESDVWNASNCSGLIVPGANNEFDLKFQGLLNESYVGGGYIRVDYRTDELRSSVNTGTDRYWFPGIEGLINLYTSMYAPGTIKDMAVYLNFYNNLTTRLNIAGVDIATLAGNASNQTIHIGNATLASILNFTDLTLKTVPIRLGTLNISYYTSDYGNADVILITDLSGSMAWQLDNNNNGYTRSCDNPNIEDSDTRRISLAKCIDIDFVNTILNSTGNQVGLVGYDGTSDDWEGQGIKVSHDLSTDNESLIDQINNDYNTGGGTCICCAIERATEMLRESKIEIITAGSDWKYNTSYQHSNPQNIGGLNWTMLDYNDTNWSEGRAPLGFSGSVATTIKKTYTVDMWDLWEDRPAPIDFTHGINTTANTFGPGAGDDGWDWQESTYGSGGWPPRDLTTLRDGDWSAGPTAGTHDGSDRLEVEIGGDNDENMDSGAFGIQININQSIVDMLRAGGEAIISFDYEAFDRVPIVSWGDETEESVWIKARFGNSTAMNWLGYDLDTGNGASDAPTDATNEILYDRGVWDNVYWHTDSVYGDFDMDGDGKRNSGTFQQNVTLYIKQAGEYYFDVGAVFDCTQGIQGKSEGIVAYFDNFNMIISNSSGNIHFRKTFSVTDPSALTNLTMQVYSDDNATIYLNGQKIDSDPSEHNAAQWNREIPINTTLLNAGDNVIAARLNNDDGIAAEFDLRMTAGDSSRQQYIIVMTDGIAGYSCGPIQYECGGGAGDCNNAACMPAIQDAIDASQTAYEDYGIIVHSVGFGPVDTCYNANYTLNNIATKGNGSYYYSTNASELQLIYAQLADQILTATRQSQTYNVIGDYTKSYLYPDSYIEINYTPITQAPDFGEITVKLQTPRFGACSQNVYIYPDTRVLDAKVTSYSAEHWTDRVSVNGSAVFNLSEYGDEYPELGDAYTVNIPASQLNPGNNLISIRTGDDSDNATGCSGNNTMIYTAAVDATISYTPVLETADGCDWTIEFDDGTTETMKVPDDYTGGKTCYFTSSNVSYDVNDTIDVAVFTLLEGLDFNEDNRSNINIAEQDMTINAIWVPRVPYMWGPSIVEVRTWQ